MALVLKDNTYQDYLAWPDDVRYELINGDAYLMSPAPDLAHQDVAGEIYRQAANALIGKSCRAFIAPVDVRLPQYNEADEQVDTVVQPDVLVVCNSHKLDKRGVWRRIGLLRCCRRPLPAMTKLKSGSCMNNMACANTG